MIKKVLLIILIILLGSLCMWAGTHDPWDGTLWDVTSPDIDQPHGNSYKEIYDLRKGVAIRANKEHVTYATSSAGGEHLNGSAVANEGTTTPTKTVSGGSTALSDIARDRGRLWLDDNYDPPVLKRWDGSAWEVVGRYLVDSASLELYLHNAVQEDTDGGRESRIRAYGEQSGGERTTLGYIEFSHDGTSDDEKGKFLIKLNDGNDANAPSLTPIAIGSDQLVELPGALTIGGVLTGGASSNIAINTDKFTVAADTGNTAVAGTLGVTGVATLGDTSALATSGAPTADAQIANKKYVDGQVCRCLVTDNQVLTANDWTILDLASDSYDPDSISDLANNKITPSKAGYYVCIASIHADGLAASSENYKLELYKNGDTSISQKINRNSSTGLSIGLSTSDVISFNGSTDYIQARFHNGHATDAGAVNNADSVEAFLSIAWLGAG